MKKHIGFVLSLLIAFMFIITTISFGDTYTPFKNQYIEGYLKSIDDKKVIIEEYDGTLHILNLLKNVELKIDGMSVKSSDFKPGMEVYGELKGRSISYLDSFSTEKLGYIPKEGKVRSGVIKKIDRNQIIIELAYGEEETIFTSPTTVVLKDGNNVSTNVLYEGDRIKAYFDDIYSSVASKIVIEGNSIVIKNFYKGKLFKYDEMEGYILLKNVDVFKNKSWVDDSSTKKLYLNENATVYIGGYEIPNSNINYYKNKTVYIAVKEIFGQEKIEKMVIKNQYESNYSSKIDEINWYSQSMELDNKRNISFNEGTIFIKNDRIVDQYSINPESDAFIVADGRNDGQIADLVYIYNENINNSNIGQNYIYALRLDEIFEYEINTEEFYLLDENEWESFDEDKEFYYDEDTYIYDLENDQQITAEEFYSDDYAVDEDSDYADDNDLRDWYAYIYADGDRVVALSAKEKMDSLLRQRITTGIIETAPEDDSMIGYNITLMNARDWSRRNDEWMMKNTSLKLILEEALIIKNDKVVDYKDLKVGDRLYIVRDDMECKIVIVK